MVLRTLAEITAEFPYDGIETEDEMDFVQFPGIGVSTAIGEKLVSLGCQVTSPQHLREHGWAFEATCDLDTYDVRISDIGDHIVLTIEVPFKIFPKARDRRFAELLSGLHASISSDPRFTGIGWYRRKEYRASHSPAPTPVG